MSLQPLLLGLAASIVPLSGDPPVVPATEALRQDTQVRQDTKEETPTGPPEIRRSSFADGLSRAQRLNRYLVAVWVRGDDPRGDAMVDTILGDPEVRRWLDTRAVVVAIDTIEHRSEANANGANTTRTPCIDVLDTATGARLERLGRDSSATDFLAAIMGVGDGTQPTRPEGEDANEPFRWLAWGNLRFLQGDTQAGPDSTEAYRWLLSSAEAHRPGFRARFFDFLVQRLNKNKVRYPQSFEVLRREIQGLAGEVEAARASRRTTYEYARLALILKQEQMLRESYKKLCAERAPGPAAERQARVRRWLVPDVAPVLGRFGEHRELLMGVGDSATEYFGRRFAALERAERARAAAAAGANAAPEESNPEESESAKTAPVRDEDHDALPYASPDSLKDSVTDAAWVFEALLATERTEEA
ncbi:MAG: hypothetical protein AAFP86_13400, partial [Planctomycetota bacterium]